MPPVFNDAETRRILALPVRPEWTKDDYNEAVSVLTPYFAQPSGTRTLKPIQARCLAEAAEYGYLVARLAPGAGKTLLYFLLPRVWEATRSLLLVPAKLKTKTIDDYWEWHEHFQLPKLHGAPHRDDYAPGSIYVQSYEALSHINYAGFLEEYRPDRILADEAHFLARLKSGRSKRVFRYLTKRAPGVLSPGSGTFNRKSIKECAHLFEAAAGTQSPLPTEYITLEQWSCALDEGVSPEARAGIGALKQLCTGEELKEGLSGVRKAVGRRISDTPGFVTTHDVACPLPIILQQIPLEVPAEIKAALGQLREDYTMPDHSDVGADPLRVWAVARQLACGFFYKFDPPPPVAWSVARRDWNSFVREAIDHPPPGMVLDTPLMVQNAVTSGKFGAVREWEKWSAIRDTFIPNTIPHWLSDFAVKAAEDWALENKGIVWCGHTAVDSDGQAIEDGSETGMGFTRIPYFGAGEGKALMKHRGPCAASIRSHGTGMNLQHFHKALIMSLPSSGSALEQLLARHHREGQKADLVEFYWYAHTRELAKALDTALNDASFASDMTGNPQRIFQADILDPDGHRLDLGGLIRAAA